MEFLSPAKINLFLVVTGKRPDGYHELFTLFSRVGIFDRIRLDPAAEGISVSCHHPDVPEDATNIAHKAAVVFCSRILDKQNIKIPGIRILIEKNIPVGAGLGGGSSNAATVLMGLNEYYGRPFSEKELMEMGLALGADVPFFIFQKPAFARGIGEELFPCPTLNPYTVVLVNPGMHISTSHVYKNLNLALTKCAQKLNCLLFKKETFRVDEHMCNDLETVAESLCPEIPLIKGQLRAYGAVGALMTGSGSTVFGLFDEKAKAQHAHKMLSENKTWKVFLSNLLV